MTRKASIALWAVQGLLAAMFLFAGGFKLVAAADQMKGPIDLPIWFLRFIGACEVLGALGLLLPGFFRVRTGLTPLAASGLVVIMIGATVINAVWIGIGTALMTVVLGVLAGCVAYGRSGAGAARGARLTT